MVFKRVLKGIGRLMLTTAVMCGVGLFLCSSEVKANVPGTLNGDENVYVQETGGKYEIVIDAPAGVNYTSISNPQILLGSVVVVDSTEFTTESSPVSNSESDPKILKLAEIPKTSVDTAVDNAVLDGIANGSLKEGTDFTTGNPINLEVNITVDSRIKTSSGEIVSKPVYKVSAEKPTGLFSEVKSAPSIKVKVGDEDRQYGYAGERYEITNELSVAKDYYMLVKTGSSNDFSASDSEWKDCSDVSVTDNVKGVTKIAENSIGSENVKYEVAYLPKVEKLAVTESTNTGSTLSSTGLEIITNSVNANTTLTYGIGAFINSAEDNKKDVILGYYNKAASGTILTNMKLLKPEPSGINKYNVKMELDNISTIGTGEVKIDIKLGNINVASVTLPITLTAVQASGFELKNEPITVISGETKTVEIIKGILPAGANQTLSNYSGIVTVTTGTDLLKNIPSYDNTKGTVTLEAKPGVTGTATVKIELKDAARSLGTQEFSVKIVSFDKDKTIDSINKSNKNYITYNKDKGYSLDIKQLIIDNAKNSNGDSITLTKDQITDVKVDGSSCSDGLWKPSEAALNKKVSFTLNGSTTIDSDKFKVSAYPMPTATYSSSNRTLTVKIPTKVSTAYSDDNNIRQSKGFKLLLVDSSGNTLYEYTDSKYQSVLSSSSESTVSYTVTASDIEGMITSAASNGKFSADTTSVKFKVIPMGYKQSSSSDETIKAKDEISGTTDAVTVYKVSASGTNFTTAAAYGLDGQTVSLTATPNSGYTFKQWSDGNTSNPRQIKVSASGTRSFQAVAGERVANSTGAGGTDNSALYDDVPKTSESNSAIWLIVFMVFAVMGTTYALYLQLRAANSKHDR